MNELEPPTKAFHDALSQFKGIMKTLFEDDPKLAAGIRHGLRECEKLPGPVGGAASAIGGFVDAYCAG